jgi:HAD superfamily hydrolase (TIGR01450 family)
VLAEARGFMFDLDGTLVQRSRDGLIALPGAAEVIAAVRRSGRPLVVFTNASHVAPAEIARELAQAGLELRDDEVITPVCSAMRYLAGRLPDRAVVVLGSEDTRRRMADAGVVVLADADGADPGAVFVAHVDEAVLERAARAVQRGAAFLTANYAAAYAGRDGPIFSRGAMVTAAIAKAAGRRPTVVGKPSRAALREVTSRLGVAAASIAVIGDDIGMDIALGRIGGSTTVLVRSGISAGTPDPGGRKGPDLVIDGISDLISMLG